MQNKIAEATAAMYKAEEEYATGTRRLTAQISAAKQEQASEARAAAKAKEQAAKEAAEAEKQAAKEAAEAEKQAAEIRAQIRRELEDAMLNTIDDATWSKWALELETLQHDYPEESASAKYYSDFVNFDHSTGAGLSYFKPEIMCAAEMLLRYKREHCVEE
jgi:hypothetical protein